MPALPAAFRRWAIRIGVALLLPAAVGAAYLVVAPGPRVSLTLPGNQHVLRVSSDCRTLVTHDGNLISSDWGPEPGTLRVWDLTIGRPGPTLEDADDVSDFDLWLSPDGRTICGKQEPATLKTWDVATGKKLGKWEPDVENGRRVCRGFTPDSRLIVLEHYADNPFLKSEAIEFWGADLRNARATLREESPLELLEPGRGWSIQWSSDGRRFATHHRTDHHRIDRVMLYELAEDDPILRPVAELAVSAGQVAFSPDLSAFAALERPTGSDSEGTLTLHDATSGEVLASGLRFGAGLRLGWMDFDRERRRLTFVGDTQDMDSCIITRTDYDLDTGESVRHQLSGDCDLMSPDRRWMMGKHAGGAIDLWDTRTGEKRDRLHHAGDEWAMGGRPVFSADGRFLLVPGLRNGAGAVSRLYFRPSLRKPVEVIRNNSVGRTWDVEARREVCAIPDCHDGYLSADGKTLVTVGFSANSVKVWNVPPRKSWGTPLVMGAVLWALVVGIGLAARRVWRRLGSPPPA